MPFLIDTNIFIYARDRRFGVREKFIEHAGEILMSAISLAELHRGLHAGLPEAALRRDRHRLLAGQLSVLPFDEQAAEAYGRIVARIGRIKMRDFDHLIAAHALSINAVLVTNNQADFAGVPGLVLENWAAP